MNRIIAPTSPASHWRLGFCLAVTWLSIDLAFAQPDEKQKPSPGSTPSSTKALPGQIVIDPEHPQWLKRHGGKHVFICGPGDPEDFLYVGKRNPDGTRDGDQVARINKLAEHGGNCIYMQIVRSHGGDAKKNGDPDWMRQNPFVDGDPVRGLDEDILKQWEEWFTLMDRNEILIYLFFYDDSARIWNTGDNVGPVEKAFVETIVKRFKHHRNLIWIIGEESEERYTTARVQALAEIIQNADDHGHIIGNHHLTGTTFKAWQPGGALNHFAMQLGKTGDEAHAGAIEALAKAAGRYQVIYAENTATPTNVPQWRRYAWSISMTGTMPMLMRMDIASTPVEMLQQFRHLQKFFEATDFWTMSSHDELKHDGTNYVLADPGRSYIAYADNLTSKLGIKGLPTGQYAVTWLDCQTGKTVTSEANVDQPGNHAFDKPQPIGAECAAWIRRVISCAAPTEERRAATRAQFGEKRDWTSEPSGQAVPWDPKQWYRFRIEWQDKVFRLLVNGEEKWRTEGPYDYAPTQHRIWLGCAPGKEKKYPCAVKDIIYRNFKVVAFTQAKAKPESKVPAGSKTKTTANRAPVPKDKKITVPAGTETIIQLVFEDEDGPGPYTYTLVRGPTHGTLEGDDNDRFYTPKSGFTGTDHFTWKVNDGQSEAVK